MGTLLSGFAFAAPWALLALAATPLVYWLLRALPPPPRRAAFPSLDILRHITVEEATPARPPWPLLALRLLLFVIVVLAFAGPRIDPGVLPAGDRPLTIVMDDGWSAAPDWEAKRQAVFDVLDAAASENRPVAFTTTAETRTGPAPVLDRAGDIRDLVSALEPKPWPGNREAAVARLNAAGFVNGRALVWIGDGVGGDAGAALARAFSGAGAVWLPTAEKAPVLVAAPIREGAALRLGASRPADGAAPARAAVIRAIDRDGAPVARATLDFAAGESEAETTISAPVDVINRIARLEIAGDDAVGAAFLLDSAWARRRVGVARLAEGGGHPLLDPARYLIEALAPFAEVEQGAVADLIERDVDAILLTDAAGADGEARDALAEWVEGGGLLIRFAGPRLAEQPDDLSPVKLRAGGRALGGPMSWSEPLPVTDLPAKGPLAGLAPPEGVAVARQALAEPGPELSEAIWAALTDGTPLVTGANRGDGLLVLVHVDAGPDWSDLPLSGFFVEMLQRLTALATNRALADRDAALPALQTLDGFGRLGAAPSGLDRLPPAGGSPNVGPLLPPGYYGLGAAPVAFNLVDAGVTLDPPPSLSSARSLTYGAADVVRFGPWLAAVAALLLLGEMLLTLGYSGRLPRIAKAAPAAAVFVLLAAAVVLPAEAQDAPNPAALETRLAYVETGDPRQDRKSRMGLAGLSKLLFARTSVEPGPPLAVNMETDEIALLPLLYWPVTPTFQTLSEDAKAKLNRYLATGGMILFDTMDADRAQTLAPFGQATDEARALQRILADTPVPPLQPLPRDHVLTRSFYLLDRIPGRYPGGQIWVERGGSSAYDGVSSLVIGAADWAGAWAIDDDGRPVFPVSPGGARQRELAFRFGVNVVMMALTGNYKGDQVHLPAIMERLGQ